MLVGDAFFEKEFNNRTDERIYFAGWNTKNELAKFIMSANKEPDIEKSTEKFLELIKIKIKKG